MTVTDASVTQMCREFVSRKIHAGAPLYGTYPPSDEILAEYRAAGGRA